MRSPITAYVVIGVACFWAYAAHNDFPSYYHADEHRKAAYVLKGENLFYHPMLLSGSAALINKVVGSTDLEVVHRIGRFVSATCGALAVVFLMGMAFRFKGLGAAWTVGTVCGSSFSLLLLAHYFKEDPAMLMGFAATFYALARLNQRITVPNLLLLGVGCGLAASSKYAGLLILPLALGAALRLRLTDYPFKPGWMRLGLVLAAFAFVAAAINFEVFMNLPRFLRGFRFEWGHINEGHHGMVSSGFGKFYFPALMHELAWPVIALAGAYAVLFARNWRSRGPLEWLILAFPIYWFLCINVSTVQLSRYLLPVTVWLHVWAALAALELIAMIPDRGRQRMAGGAALLAVLILPNVYRSGDYLHRIKHDSRIAFAEWTRKNLPKDAYLVEDLYVRLKNYKQLDPAAYPFELLSPYWACRVGTLEEARQKGVTHVAVTDLVYERLYHPGYEASRTKQGRKIKKYRKFYDELFAQGKLVWEYDPPYNMKAFTDPKIQLYQIADVPTSGTQGGDTQGLSAEEQAYEDAEAEGEE